MSSNIETIRICQECNERFVAKTTVTKFCCLKCNRRNYKKRSRNIKAELGNEKTIEKFLLPQTDLGLKDYISVKDACALLTISRTTLWRLISQDKIKSVKIGSRIVISRNSIDILFN